MNPVLAKHNPQWFAEIKEIDESIFINNDALFRKSRVELAELHDQMQRMSSEVQQSNNAVARHRFNEQLGTLETWQQWLEWPMHQSFDATEGFRLLEWIWQRHGDVPITSFMIAEAYSRLKDPEPVREPDLPPSITKQPESISVEPLEAATFSVEVSGTQPMEFQWLINGSQKIPGEKAQQPTYVTFASEYNDGALFACRITNKFGSITSYPATLKMVRK